MHDRGQRRPRFCQAVGANGFLTLWITGLRIHVSRFKGSKYLGFTRYRLNDFSNPLPVEHGQIFGCLLHSI